MGYYLDDEEQDDEYLPSEQELRKDIARLKRQMKKEQKWHDDEVEALRGQIRDLLAKNMQLTETNNIFAKGLENLKREYIVTETHYWTWRGKRGLDDRIKEFAEAGKRIVSICPMHIDAHGKTEEAWIITEHTTKIKPAPTRLFRE